MFGIGVEIGRRDQATREEIRGYLFKRRDAPFLGGADALLDQRDLMEWILNFPTKDHWRSRSKVEDIGAGLAHLEAHYQEWGLTSLVVPALGCGHGRLRWEVMGPLLYAHFSRYAIPVILYAPPATPSLQLTHDFLTAPTHVARLDKKSRGGTSRREEQD